MGGDGGAGGESNGGNCRATNNFGSIWVFNPIKFNQLGKTVLSFFGLSKDTLQNEN